MQLESSGISDDAAHLVDCTISTILQRRDFRENVLSTNRHLPCIVIDKTWRMNNERVPCAFVIFLSADEKSNSDVRVFYELSHDKKEENDEMMKVLQYMETTTERNSDHHITMRNFILGLQGSASRFDDSVGSTREGYVRGYLDAINDKSHFIDGTIFASLGNCLNTPFQKVEITQTFVIRV